MTENLTGSEASELERIEALLDAEPDSTEGLYYDTIAFDPRAIGVVAARRAGAGGGGSQPFTKETTLVTVADLETLHATPVEVTTAAPAGSMLVPIQMLASQEGPLTPWTFSQPPVIYVTTVEEWTNQNNQGTWGRFVRNPFIEDGITGSIPTSVLFEGYDDLSHAGADGQALAIVSDTAISGGQARLTVITWYATVVIPS